MKRTKRPFGLIAATALFFGCGGSGPEVDLPGDVSIEEPETKPPDDRVKVPIEEVDYEGFTVAPPSAPLDGRLKQSFEEKMSAMVESADVPSTFGGAFFQLGRAYLSGREPVTQIEEVAFEAFDSAPSHTLEALERTLNRIDELPEEDMTRLYGANFVQASADDVLTNSILSNALFKEIKDRATIERYSDLELALDEERAGLVRAGQCAGVDGFSTGPCPNICRVKTVSMGGAPAIRTSSFVPELTAADYLEREVESDRSGACRGNVVSTDGERVCLRVPMVRAGETIRLEGFNFHDVNAEVHLVPVLGPVAEPTPYVIEAHVRGATVSPLDRLRWDAIGSIGDRGSAITGSTSAAEDAELQNGPPATCSAGDEIHFQVPSDIFTGMYRVRVVMRDPVETYEERFVSNQLREPFIQVVSPAATEYEITAERVTNAGTYDWEYRRDEIGLKFYIMASDKLETFEFEYGGVSNYSIRCIGTVTDDGECIHQTLFSGNLSVAVPYAILGLEIDDRDAYENKIRDWETLYEQVNKGIYGKIATGVGGLVGTLVGKVTSKEIGAALGSVMTEGIKRGIVAWAAADVRIADRGAFTFGETDLYTSPLSATPVPYRYDVNGDVDVVVEPCEDTPGYRDRWECDAEAKGPGSYREIREYYVGVSPDYDCGYGFEDGTGRAGFIECPGYGSRYQLTLRYDRLD